MTCVLTTWGLTTALGVGTRPCSASWLTKPPGLFGRLVMALWLRLGWPRFGIEVMTSFVRVGGSRGRSPTGLTGRGAVSWVGCTGTGIWDIETMGAVVVGVDGRLRLGIPRDSLAIGERVGGPAAAAMLVILDIL